MLIWGNETYEDGVDIHPSEFYARLKTSKTMPTTSQVTPGSFQKVFSTLLEQEYQILAILISEKLSGTVASAIQAKEMFPGAAIELVDSHTTSLAMGFQIFAVAEAIETRCRSGRMQALAERARTMSASVSLWIHSSSSTVVGGSAAAAVSWVRL